MHQGPERTQRYCTKCGAQVSPGDAFCGSCGARLSSGPVTDDPPTREIPELASERTSGYALPTLRFPGVGRDIVLGILLALACAGLPVAVIYAALAIRGTFSNPEVPATVGLALFALLHGGGATVDIPPIPSLFGLGGSIRLGLPITSFALIPFLAALLYLISSITTAPNLDEWYHSGTSSGAYLVASKKLAQDYTDYELTHSLMNAEKNEKCTAGPYEDINRASYSGKIQTWYDCGVSGATTFSVAASPPGRDCVAVLGAKISDEADRKAIEHLMDTFEVDCSHVTSKTLKAPSSAASAASSPPEASVAASASVPAGAEAQGGGCSDPSYKAQNPGECGTAGYNPVSDSGDNYSQGVVVGDDTPDCARPEDVLESGLCAP